MKHLKITITTILLLLLTFSCSSDDNDSTDLPTEAEIDNVRFFNPFVLGAWEGVDECIGNTCFNMPIEYDLITFKETGEFINDRTELVTDGEIENTYGFVGTNQFIISEKEPNGETFITYQRITKITNSELEFEEFRNSEIGDYKADRVVKYIMRKINQ